MGTRIIKRASLLTLVGVAASIAPCGCSRERAGVAGAAGADDRAVERGPEAVMLARTTLTNQTGTRVRVLMCVVEVSEATAAAPRWWWGEPVVLTATMSHEYALRALSSDKAPVAGQRSVLLRVEALLGTRVETTAWYNVVGPMPRQIDIVRSGDDVAPACYPPATLETLAPELWPTEKP